MVKVSSREMFATLNRGETGAFLNGVLIVAEPDNNMAMEKVMAEKVMAENADARLVARHIGGLGKVVLEYMTLAYWRA